MGKILNAILLFIPVLTGLIACNEDSCTESTSVNTRVSFYSKADKSSLTFDSISIKGIGQPKDSLLLNKITDLHSVQLPLRILADSTAFEIQFYRSNTSAQEQTDTIWFYHQNKPQYISPECGCTIFYHIDSVKYTQHRIDSVKITQPEITNYDEEHIQILF